MSDPVDEKALREGLLSALQLYLAETPLSHAVGETGTLSASVQIFFEKGRAQWSKGGVSFERRIQLGGRA